MGSSLQAKGNAIYRDTATDLSAAIGKLVTFTGGVPAVNASATVPAVGIVLDARKKTSVNGSTTYYDNQIAILGRTGPVRALLSATSAAVNFGDTVMQAADGTVTKDVTGSARVVTGVCTDENGAQPGDLFEICTFDGDIRTY